MGQFFRHDRSVRDQTLAKLQKSVAWVDAKTGAKIMEKIVFDFRVVFAPHIITPIFRLISLLYVYIT